MSKKALKIAKKAKKYAKKAYYRSKVLIIAITIFSSMILPHNSMAVTFNSNTPEGLSSQLDEPSPNQMLKIQEYSILSVSKDDLKVLTSGSDTFPESKDKKPRILRVSVSAYTSEVAQTDASPCITANGFNVCEHGEEDVIATNMLPFGTKVKIPAYSGDKIYEVVDRMNTRYQQHADIWMLNKEDAIKFGRRTLDMYVYQ